MMHKICQALYYGVTPQREMLSGRLAYFSHWMVSPLAMNTYQDLLQNEIAKLPQLAAPPPPPPPVRLTVSCAESVTASPSPDSQSSSSPSPSLSSSATLMRPPSDRPVRSASTDTRRSTIASLSKRPTLSRASAPESDESEDLGISAERLAAILESATDKRRRIGTVSTSEFKAAVDKNKADATRATVQTTTTTTTAALLHPSVIKDESSGSNTPSNELRASSTDLHEALQQQQEEHRQITTNNTSLISKNPQAVIQFLQMIVNQQFESTNVIGSIGQLCLVVALEPIDLSINLSLERRRNTSIITNSLMEVYANVVHGEATQQQQQQQQAANETQMMTIAANDRLSINFFSRFPELAIQCKSLGDGVLKAIFALGSLAKFAFDLSRSHVTPQGEVLLGYRFNEVLDEEMGDRGRLVEGLCRAMIVGAGGEHKRTLVSELFSSALHGASERVYSLRAAGTRAGLPAENKFMTKLRAAEQMLSDVARKLAAEK